MSVTRINWVDYAKGVCIIGFVLAQSVYGYVAMTGQSNWMHFAAAWAAPIILPTLFIVILGPAGCSIADAFSG